MGIGKVDNPIPRLEEGVQEAVQEAFLEDAPMEQVATKVPETSQGSKSHNSSPTGPGYVPFVSQNNPSSPIYSPTYARPL